MSALKYIIVYVKYLKYVIVHKYWVAYACFRQGLWWRAIAHDVSKLFPSEFFPYAHYFCGDIKRNRDKTGYYKPTDTGDQPFEQAWLKHTRRNNHHWQYWVISTEDNEKRYPMPINSVIEMLCDWYGAGRAQNAKSSVIEWFAVNRHKMKFHQTTLEIIEQVCLDDDMFLERRS